MDDFSSNNFASPPSSLTDGFTSAQGTVPPVPRPRRGSSSTPKQAINFHGPLTRSNQSCSSTGSCNRSTSNKCNKMHRTTSFDSSGHCEIKIKPIDNLVDNSDVDSEDEESHSNLGNSSDRINSNCRPNNNKRSHPRFASRSLPVTPRVNGSCSNTQSQLNGGISCFLSSNVGSSTPLLVAPHLAPHFPLEGSFNSISSLSPITSQYVTCSSGILSESHDKILPGSIDYSSLPLPKEESIRTPNKRNISRHMSEPCIHEIPNNHLGNNVKCHSCPNKKISSKHKKRENFVYAEETETTTTDRENQFRNSIGGIDSRPDSLETVEMQWKFIKTLIDELNKCRSQNNRMTVELHQSQMEIQMLKGALDAYAEAGVQSGVLTEMVGQIHAAQKIRDEAMMSRIKLANEERDAAINQLHQLLEKFGCSHKSSVDNIKCSSFNFNDQENFHISPPKTVKENLSLATIEDELRALKLATQISEQDRLCHADSACCKGKEGKEVLGERQEVLEELKTKLKESEISKQKLQERCSSLEHFFGHLHRKVNGLNSVEGLPLNPTSLTVLDMSIFGGRPRNGGGVEDRSEGAGTPPSSRPTTTAPEEQSSSPSPRHRRKKPPDENRHGGGGVEDNTTETEGDSLSSTSSSESAGDTSSAASWKHVACGTEPHQRLQAPSYSDSLATHSSQSMHTRHSSLTHSLDCANNNNNSSSSSSNATSSAERINVSPSLKSEFKPRNLGGVTLMGPITEL